MPTAYLSYELWWAVPVIAVMWLACGRELWRHRRVLTLAVLLSTVYLDVCDALALGHGIWHIDPHRTLGLHLGPLPLEEALFYFLTNLMAAQGFVLIVGYLRDWKNRR